MILYGASGHAKVIIDILEMTGREIDFIVDDNAEINSLLGYEVRRNCGHYDSAIVSIGDGRIRQEIVRRLDVRNWEKAIHPNAVVSVHATIGDGSVVMAGAVINSGANIGRHCIVNTGATVDHDVQMEDFVHVAPGVHVSGGVSIGEGTWIGVGSCIKQGVKIGKNCMIGAGSVVVKDIPDGVTAYGCPCKVKDNKNTDKDFEMNKLLNNSMGGVKSSH